jgi:GWxTD domain-containing protein
MSRVSKPLLTILFGTLFVIGTAALVCEVPIAAAQGARGDEPLRDASPEMRHEIAALQYLLYPSQQDELLSFDTDYSRRRWIEAFWRSKDPVYTTADNEARAEHIRRVAYAGQEFSAPKWPGWDQRGEVHIRYGPPAYRELIHAEVFAKGTTPQGELWFYPDHEMYVMFELTHAGAGYTYYLEHVRGPSGIRMEKIGEAIDASIGASLAPPDIAWQSPMDRYKKMLNKFYELSETTPSVHRLDLEHNKMPFIFEIDGFRGGELIDRVDVNLEFMADISWRDFGEEANEYIATAVFWDTDRKEVGRREHTLKVPLTVGAVDSTRLMPAQIALSLPPGFYHMAVTLEERPSRRCSSYRMDVTCEDFESKLAMSDIVFASRIDEAERSSPFVRGALEVVPHPAKTYVRAGAIPVYFEVYNLDEDERGVSSYLVEYRVVSRTPKDVNFWKSIAGVGGKTTIDVAQRFRGSSHGPHDPIHISLRSDNLWPGEFALHVKITDELSEAEVTRETVFNIVE